MTEKQEITILGLGNILMKDDGFGVHFLRWFEERWALPDSVRNVEGGVMAYALLEPVCSCRHLIVVDVLKVADEPGSVYRFTLAEIEPKLPPPTSAHEVQFLDVLCKAELLGEAPEVVFLCIVPADFREMDLELSPLMREKFPLMEKLLIDELQRHSVAPVKIHA
ncbi:hydrogenase maturation protease [Syntrophus gentianae]|uniref:Hydrogenase maturation protease n=1 Tax=Syntrophus gentianae TaxID=43775 RepID=A0A1H7YHL6_9BACT|nr:hydrogenase maturation protease [Syntrophus gentianae]SEM45364.1 hydrogenase maturation protease [Syntrophus gentianae]